MARGQQCANYDLSGMDKYDIDGLSVVLPFKDQASADILRTQLKDLSQKINTTIIQAVFVSHKIERDLKLREVMIKPPVVNQQCLVYLFICDLCDTGYVGLRAGTCINASRSTRTCRRLLASIFARNILWPLRILTRILKF